ncbi:DUF6099 family protein [Streptomyces tsukubensis]|uniref:Uncharacterized protein n=1 Tax=Streptomyces tsukubensis TaxID=83656 RepID=A0A1V4A9R5_9ACTN|nr:DUF6099 family protein [Streptomyces tsukubensis]OON80547.1 hypothetical protein B1H18_11650 [Streptomyces tsukubensis]QFR96198.1 hypothetical protein GBW32_28125 [Streptomyces tsukubensis]
MDALRLIGTIERALTQARSDTDIMAEAWQAQTLAQAMGSRLAVTGPPELRGEALGLCEVSGRGCGALSGPGLGSGGIRAARLTGIADAGAALTALGVLLGDVGMALVAVACSVEEESVYWQCIEAIDAADESRDRVLEMLRRLAVREQGLPASDAAVEPS